MGDEANFSHSKINVTMVSLCLFISTYWWQSMDKVLVLLGVTELINGAHSGGGGGIVRKIKLFSFPNSGYNNGY